MKHVMLDLETLSLRPTASIIAIGAVIFDGLGIQSRFGINTLDDVCRLRVDEATVAWWRQPENQEAWSRIRSDTVSLKYGLKKLIEFLPKEEFCIWSNGSEFDIPILKNALCEYGLDVPWKYSNTRCYRTVKSLFPQVTRELYGVKHDPLDDAEGQARHLLAIRKAYMDYTGAGGYRLDMGYTHVGNYQVDILLSTKEIDDAYHNSYYGFVLPPRVQPF